MTQHPSLIQDHLDTLAPDSMANSARTMHSHSHQTPCVSYDSHSSGKKPSTNLYPPGLEPVMNTSIVLPLRALAELFPFFDAAKKGNDTIIDRAAVNKLMATSVKVPSSVLSALADKEFAIDAPTASSPEHNVTSINVPVRVLAVLFSAIQEDADTLPALESVAQNNKSVPWMVDGEAEEKGWGSPAWPDTEYQQKSYNIFNPAPVAESSSTPIPVALPALTPAGPIPPSARDLMSRRTIAALEALDLDTPPENAMTGTWYVVTQGRWIGIHNNLGLVSQKVNGFKNFCWKKEATWYTARQSFLETRDAGACRISD